MKPAPGGPERRFQLVLLKPSHYDDDGYVIQWVRAYIPSNTLAVLYTLALDASERGVLGPDTAIDITVVDEINSHVNIKKLLERFQRHDGFGLVALAGVQSNQYPRALDIARPFRAAGVPVLIGGFHVSGVLAMLPELTPELKATVDMGISMFAGELEGRMDLVLQDAANGTMPPIYNYLKELPALESEPTPILPIEHLRKTIQKLATFDAGRGCPYQCSFCTIINVQGKKSRRRSADDVEKTIREHWAQGITNFFITDDNLGRNKDWEPIFDRIIEMRERDGMNIRLMIQVDTLCHKIPNFIEKAVRAGTNRALIGLESINAANLLAASKRQNKITEYRKMLLAWKKAGTITVAGYILGFPFDTPESIREDLKIIQKELPLDFLEFFCLTPLPGSQDHQVLYRKGEWMHEDLNLLRWRARGHQPSENDQGGVGRNLSDRVDDLLYARARRNHPAARGGNQLQPVAHAGSRVLVLHVGSGGKCPPSARRPASPEAPARSPSRDADRTDLVVLSEIRLELHQELVPRVAHNALAPGHEPAHLQEQGSLCLHRPGADPGDRRRDGDAGIVHPQRGRAPIRQARAKDCATDRQRERGLAVFRLGGFIGLERDPEKLPALDPGWNWFRADHAQRARKT